MFGQRQENTSRLLAKLVRDLLTTSWATVADLTDALKARCARLRIPITPDDINDAYRLIGSNAALVDDPAPASVPPEHAGGLSHTAACELLARLQLAVPLRAMPALRALSPEEQMHRAWQEQKARAFDIVAAELLATEQRVAKLEAAVDVALELASSPAETAMRTWTRARLQRTCGGCGGNIARGAPLLEMRLPGVQARKIRGECCEGPAPADLAPLAAPAPPPEPIPLVRTTPTLPLDWRARAAGERDDPEAD